MPCGSGARTEDSRLLQMAASTASPQQAQQLGGIGDSAGHLHHLGRFHVSHASLACHVEAAAAVAAAAGNSNHHQHDEMERAAAASAAWDHQCLELHSAVGNLDSLPWCRSSSGGRHHPALGGPQAAATTAATFQAMPELAEEAQLDTGAAAKAAAEASAASSASAAASVTAAAAAAGSVEAEAAEAAEDVAEEDGGCTLTAQMGKSISQVRMSASSSNFPSLDCRCCCDDGDHHSGPSLEPQPPRSPQPPTPLAAAVADSGSAAASHLEPPWSSNSGCRSLSQRPSSPASLWRLAACHRSERVGPTGLTRSASFRRRTSAAGHQQQQPHQQGVTSGGCAADCCGPLMEQQQQQHHVTYQEYLDQLRERVQLWLLGSSDTSDEGAEEDEEEKLEDIGAAEDGVYCYHDDWTSDD